MSVLLLSAKPSGEVAVGACAARPANAGCRSRRSMRTWARSSRAARLSSMTSGSSLRLRRRRPQGGAKPRRSGLTARPAGSSSPRLSNSMTPLQSMLQPAWDDPLPSGLRGGLVRAIPGIAADADTYACLRCRAARGDGSAVVMPVVPHGRLSYDIHARFGAGRCASAGVGSRGPWVDSVLIVGHAGTAPAGRGSAGESALRRDRWCGVLPGGERGRKLAAGADAELGEDFPQVVGDGGGADEQLRGDLRVGGAFAGEAGDQRFLRGQGVGRLDGVLPGVPAGCPQLDTRPFGKRRGADRVKDLMRAAELVAGVTSAPLAAQPLSVNQAGAGAVNPQPGMAQAVDRLAVEVL